MIQVSVAEARNRLSQLLQAVEKGQQVTIYRHGKPIVELIRAVPQRKPRVFGAQSGGEIIDPDWAKPQNDIEAWLRGDV